MPKIEFEIVVAAPVERVFDLARSIDLHQSTMSDSGERAVGGVTSGLIGDGETVTWEATHFGVRQRLTSKITIFDRPRHFRDEMVDGAFAAFEHDHFFDGSDGSVLMREIFEYRSPLGLVGRFADILFLERYMTRLLYSRAEIIKRVAETDEWRSYLDSEA